MITAPIRLTGSVHPQQLATIIAIDALTRRQRAVGVEIAPLELTTIAGDVATQHAVQRVVVREGDDREEMGREGFAARADRLHFDAQTDLRQLVASIGFDFDIDRWAAGGENAASAARVAFVRLYESGVLSRTEAVVDSCPSCETVIDDADIDDVEIDVVQLRLRVATTQGEIELETFEPELIVGAVALAVPRGHAAAGATAYLPVLDSEVPVVEVEGTETVALVVPGHHQWSYEVARHIGATVRQVLDGEGVVRHPGSLEGLSRYAARSAAREQLEGDNAVVARFDSKAIVRRCHRCATVLVPLRGRHWILNLHSAIEPVLERLRNGDVAFSPTTELDHMAEIATTATTWCVSQQLWSGQPIPAVSCLDCGQTTVSVEMPESCPCCMGTVAPDTDVLDARFIATVVPLAMLGWPTAFDVEAAKQTTVSVGRTGLDVWALPMVLLGLRLADTIPFSQVLVHQFAIGAPETGPIRTAQLTDMVAEFGPRITRAALLNGDLDTERAKETVALIDAPNEGRTELKSIIEHYDKAIAALDPGGAFAILANAARDGVEVREFEALRAMTIPLLGS